MDHFCNQFRSSIIDVCFRDDRTNKLLSTPSNFLYCWTPRYQEQWQILQGIIEMCDMLGIQHLEERKPHLMERIMFLNTPDSIPNRSYFETYIDYIRQIFKEVEKEVIEKLHLLNKEEATRLNEALNCYIEGCNYAAVAMSVSVIEFRLLSLMTSKCPDPKLEELTLGQLIREYLDNKKKYGNIIPKKHEPLLEHCNTYRIFSVHHKKEKITRPIATSIINMTFTFLLDEKLKRKAEEK